MNRIYNESIMNLLDNAVLDNLPDGYIGWFKDYNFENIQEIRDRKIDEILK